MKRRIKHVIFVFMAFFAFFALDNEKVYEGGYENDLRHGEGIATLVTSINYPGYPALYPLCRAIAREMITLMTYGI